MAAVFERIEKKYFLTQVQYEMLKAELMPQLIRDTYYEYDISNIYFDTDTDSLISHSVEKPKFKEKLRLRGYNAIDYGDTVYLEIKRKYDGTIYKRRIALTLQEAEDYIERGKRPNVTSQVLEEIDYMIKSYNLKPKIYLAYHREAYVGKDNKDLRVTFDSDIISRRKLLWLEFGKSGESLLKNGERIMEIKANGAIPLWLVRILNTNGIYPVSFSKYGEIYKMENKEQLYV